MIFFVSQRVDAPIKQSRALASVPQKPLRLRNLKPFRKNTFRGSNKRHRQKTATTSNAENHPPITHPVLNHTHPSPRLPPDPGIHSRHEPLSLITNLVTVDSYSPRKKRLRLRTPSFSAITVTASPSPTDQYFPC